MNVLQSLLDDLRPHVMSAAVAPRGMNVPVRDLVVYDPLENLDVAEGDIVLGVGLTPDERTTALVAQLGSARAAAIVLKIEPPIDTAFREAADRAGVAVLLVPHATSWGQLIVLMRSALAQSAFVVAPEVSSNLAADDLFGVADALANLVDAPVTIEDPQSKVIAYSGRQEDADASRVETILGRHVSDRIIRHLRREGIFERLARTTGPVYVEVPATMPRVAVALRAGGEIVGSVWAAVKGPPSDERLHAFVEATKLVAFHVARLRLEAGLNRRARAQLVLSILNGRPDAPDAAQQLNFGGKWFRVLATEVDSQSDANSEFLCMRLWDLVDFNLAAVLPNVLTTLANRVVYAIVAEAERGQTDRAWIADAANGVATRASIALHATPRVGIGRRVARLAEIPRSRVDAEEVIGLLREEPSRRVADVADVRLQLLLKRLSAIVGEDEVLLGGPLDALVEHDAAHHTDYVDTLSAYLDAFGNVLDAAERMNLHPNTFRYRLGKLRQLGGLRLDDPDQRLELTLQLRLLHRRRHEKTD